MWRILFHRVVGTASVYFRRFYLVQDFCRHDPRDIGIACRYLACKAEEAQVAAKVLFQIMKNTPRNAPLLLPNPAHIAKLRHSTTRHSKNLLQSLKNYVILLIQLSFFQHSSYNERLGEPSVCNVLSTRGSVDCYVVLPND